MEKLERVLLAEDDARAALADARTESARLRAAGVQDARRIEEDAASACDATIASERDSTLASARAEAARITADAAAVREATLSGARARLDDTVRRIAASLET